MSEFEKEYNDLGFRAQALDAVLADKDIVENFKDWQPPKPLVKVPRIVADFIKTLKIRGIKPLMDSVTFGEIDFTEEKRDEILHWINEHQEEYMRAWIDGYTVEKEPLYALEFPKQLNTFVAYTVKNQDNEVIISGYTSIKKGAKRFTEKEIKDIDPRYLAYAVKVDEVEG